MPPGNLARTAGLFVHEPILRMEPAGGTPPVPRSTVGMSYPKPPTRA